jgi:hypothetical protein
LSGFVILLLFGWVCLGGENLLANVGQIGIIDPHPHEIEITVMLEYQTSKVDSWWHATGW